MIEAGYRRRMLPIPFDPAGAARRIRRIFTDDQVHEPVVHRVRRRPW